MSPQVCSLEIWDVGFPRVSGDEPVLRVNTADVVEFSPRERG